MVRRKELIPGYDCWVTVIPPVSELGVMVTFIFRCSIISYPCTPTCDCSSSRTVCGTAGEASTARSGVAESQLRRVTMVTLEYVGNGAHTGDRAF